MLKITKTEKKTRSIFDKIHTAQAGNKEIFSRISSLLTTEYFKTKKDFFKNKVCLDAGCGSNANASLFMLHMGAEKVYAFDLDNSILKNTPEHLKEFEGKYDLKTGNVLRMDYPDNFFDFTYCCGVLHHTSDPFKGIGELSRVTKPGGALYIMLNGKGGLIHEFRDFLRNKYSKEKTFKHLVDNLTKKQLIEFFSWITKTMRENNDKLANTISPKIIKELFNDDLILTIKDRLTAPMYHAVSEREIVGFLKKNGFKKIERLTRYPVIHNIRAFLCPLYSNYKNKFSRFLYGEGSIQLKAVKI